MNSAVAPRPARSLAARNAWMLLAMLPALCLLCLRDPSMAGRLALTACAALLVESLALLLRRQPLRPFLREGSWLAYASLLVACLSSRPAWHLLCAVFVALALARQAFGGLGRNLFHPVAAGVAFVLALDPAGTATPIPDPALALAWAAGGAWLLALRIVRWPAPACLLLAALIGILASGQDWQAFADPGWALAAFFIAGDPVTTPEDARGRALAAGAVGLVAALAGIATLPFALLAMNAATPALDAWLAPRHVRPVTA